MTLADMQSALAKLEARLADPSSYTITGSHSVTYNQQADDLAAARLRRRILLYQGYTGRMRPDLSGDGGTANDY